MKDIKKLNSALNDIDERLIEEAAQGGRARSVPGLGKVRRGDRGRRGGCYRRVHIYVRRRFQGSRPYSAERLADSVLCG